MEAIGVILIVIGIAFIVMTYTESTGAVLEAMFNG